jgi:hypothetical protein
MVSWSFTVAKAPAMSLSFALGANTMHRPVVPQSGFAGGDEELLLHPGTLARIARAASV